MGKREGKSSKRSKPEVEEETNAADEARSQPAIAEEPPAKQPKTEHGGQDDKSSSVSAASEPNPAAEQSDEVGKMSSKALPADLSGVVANVPRMKTSLCSYFRKGNCRHGDLCRYAHGEAELKPRPDGSWDPTSDFAKSLARDALPVPAAVKLVAPISVAEEAAEDDSSEITIKKCITPVQPRWSNDDLKKFLTDMVMTGIICASIDFFTSLSRNLLYEFRFRLLSLSAA